MTPDTLHEVAPNDCPKSKKSKLKSLNTMSGESESCSVMSDFLRPHELYSPWNSPGQNTGVGSLSFLQWILPTQESNQGHLHCRWILYQLRYKGQEYTTKSVSQFSCSVMSDSLRSHGLQHARLPCPSPTPGAYSKSCPLHW